jgi:hypothetical protein
MRLHTYLNMAIKQAGEDAPVEKKQEQEQDQNTKSNPQQTPPVAAATNQMAQQALPSTSIPLSPFDVMGQGLQQATSGMNQVIDAFYALQGGSNPNTSTPSPTPLQGSSSTVNQMPQQNLPTAPMQIQGVAPAQPATGKSAAAYDMQGRYTAKQMSSGSAYYSLLRSKLQS